MKENALKYNTLLPSFEGFKDSMLYFEDSFDEINYERAKCGLSHINDVHEIGFDQDKYSNEIAKQYCEAVEKLINLVGIRCEIKFIEIEFTKDYSKSNDTIAIELTLPRRSQLKLDKLVREYFSDVKQSIRETFDTYLGYAPLVSNDINDWLDAESKYYVYNNPIQISWMIEFVLDAMIGELDFDGHSYDEVSNFVNRYVESNKLSFDDYLTVSYDEICGI